MERIEILRLLDSLIQKSEVMVPRDNDPSGIYTEYRIDSELLRAHIEEEIEKEQTKDPHTLPEHC